MERIGAKDARAMSADVIAENIRQLKTLFPELVTEGADGAAVNVDILKQLVGQTVVDEEEKYGLNWHGKRAARRLALTPSTGTLRPCPEESVDWDTTQNLMIEGDNLEVLKLLQKSYAGKVKLIYIDPPYNTGNDFVYPDDYRDGIQNYLELTGQVEGGKKISSNAEASGRFHTNWLNMMYPRLKLARNLLKDDGAILVSIDDRELANLRSVMEDVFGSENFVADLVWENREGGGGSDSTLFKIKHEYVVAFARRLECVGVGGVAIDNEDRYTEEDQHVDQRGKYLLIKLNSASIQYSKSLDYPIVSPDGTQVFPALSGKKACWRWSKKKVEWGIQNDFIVIKRDRDGQWAVYTKQYLKVDNECRPIDRTKRPMGVIEQYSSTKATKDLDSLLGDKVFEYSKPYQLIQYLAGLLTQPSEGDLVADFFAGSGTTGHALMAQNAVDGGNRGYLLVQLPELIDPENKDQKIAADFCDKLGKPRTIAEITKERLRRAAKKIREENPLFTGDLGFRVFKLASTNIREWDSNPSNVTDSLLDSVEHLKTDRTEDDILYELLLKRGLDLCVPMETRIIAGKTVHSVGAGTLIVCLAPGISRDEAEPLAQGIIAWHKELAPAGDTTCVFRDSGFVDDVAKTNLAAILQQAGLEHVESL